MMATLRPDGRRGSVLSLTIALLCSLLGQRLEPVEAGKSRAMYIPGFFSTSGYHEVIKKSDTQVSRIGIFHVFRKPPWGGGNQFLMALAGEIRSRGIDVIESTAPTDSSIPIYMANAITFKRKEFSQAMAKRKKGIKLVHRLDGPYSAARYEHDPRTEGKKPWRCKEDEEVYEINKMACATIYQSQWSLDMNLLLGFKPSVRTIENRWTKEFHSDLMGRWPKEPIRIIPNAVDAGIFHNRTRSPWDPSRKTRLISSAWSDGERKGFSTVEWLDKNLDFSRYEYLFKGRVPRKYTFSKVRTESPTSSEELATVLRYQDIYLATSFLEPCSNALLEALSSGLPTLYQRGSGHDELVGDGGIGYDHPQEIPGLLDKLTRNYEMYQSAIRVLTIKEVTDRYLEVFSYCLKQG